MNRILDDVRVTPLCKEYGRERVRDWARSVLARLRTVHIDLDATNSSEVILNDIVDELRTMAEQRQGSRLQRVINGTGVILHTNLGRAPLAKAAVDAVAETAAYCNLELDLETGGRGQRTERVEQLWCELTGAEAAIVVNNCAAATFLTLRILAGSQEVIVSRGQLIEIGGSYRLPDVFEEAGVRLREVGTTNKTHLSDYERAIGEETAALLRVHPSNYRQIGFTKSVSAGELGELAHRHSLPLIDDVGSGCIIDLTTYGLQEEPTVARSLNDGADVVLFSGDKLFGGPQCGMILGQKAIVDRLRTSPLTRALRVGKLTLAALEATLQIYLAGRAVEEIPVLRAITQSADVLHKRADRIREQLASTVPSADVDVQPVDSTIGGGSLPGETLPSWGVIVTSDDCSGLASALRTGDPALMTRIRHHAVCIDLRTVADDEDVEVARALMRALGGE